MEAGCMKKKWEMRNGIPFRYRWMSAGKLLAIGVCIMDDYEKDFPPEDGKTKVHSTIGTQVVRDVDAKKKTLSIDFTLTLRWMDKRIKKRINQTDESQKKILFGPVAIEKIWYPDLHILNRVSFKSKEEWASLVTTSILSSQDINRLNGKDNTKYECSIPTVEMKYEVKTTVYCPYWSYTIYPMDRQFCTVSFGSASENSIFSLYDELRSPSRPYFYKAVDFEMTVDFFDRNFLNGSNHVDIEIVMTRLTMPFILKYYVPCIAIVLISAIGFIIPISAIPGRVGLLVTQFLTLVNLFIHQMVSNSR